MNIIPGRAVRDDGPCNVYGCVNREVTSAATRLDHFLSEQDAAQAPTVILANGIDAAMFAEAGAWQATACRRDIRTKK